MGIFLSRREICSSFIPMAKRWRILGLRIRNSGVERKGGTAVEPSKLYRSHAPRPGGENGNRATPPRRSPLRCSLAPFVFQPRSCPSTPSPVYAPTTIPTFPTFFRFARLFSFRFFLFSSNRECKDRIFSRLSDSIHG